MLIPVVYTDNSSDMIESQSLSSLLRKGIIKSFKRSSGWVHVGKDSIRRFDHHQAKDLPHKNHQRQQQESPQQQATAR